MSLASSPSPAGPSRLCSAVRAAHALASCRSASTTRCENPRKLVVLASFRGIPLHGRRAAVFDVGNQCPGISSPGHQSEQPTVYGQEMGTTGPTFLGPFPLGLVAWAANARTLRSEEHTSELQS